MDALEQWVRVVGTGDVDRLAAAPELPHGPVPGQLVVRAKALQVAMTDAEVVTRGAQRALDRQRAYAAA